MILPPADNEKLLKFAGFTLKKHSHWVKAPEHYHWFFPDGRQQYGDTFTIDLPCFPDDSDACFKYLEPALLERFRRMCPTEEEARALYYAFLKTVARKQAFGELPFPAAYSVATLQMIDGLFSWLAETRRKEEAMRRRARARYGYGLWR